MTDYEKIRRNAAKLGRDAMVVAHGPAYNISWKAIQAATDAAISFYNASLDDVSEQLGSGPAPDPLQTCDAEVWAREFLERATNGTFTVVDVDLMRGWFANAIEYAAANHPDVVRLKKQLEMMIEERDWLARERAWLARVITEDDDRLTRGSAFDFACWLTTRPTVITVGGSETVYAVFEALREFQALQGGDDLTADEALRANSRDVETLAERLAKVEDQLAEHRARIDGFRDHGFGLIPGINARLGALEANAKVVYDRHTKIDVDEHRRMDDDGGPVRPEDANQLRHAEEVGGLPGRRKFHGAIQEE